MIFSSLFFTFAFLPVAIIMYYLLKKSWRNIVLLLISLFFYAWGEPIYVLLMCSSIIINHFIGNILGDIDKRKGKIVLITSIILNLGLLAYFKYFGMIINSVASTFNLNLNIEIPTLPIGISFYTFQILSYIVDVYRKKIKPQKSLIISALYITMFPQLVAGPIIHYADIEDQLVNRDINLKNFNLGIQRFVCGLAKKVLLANNIGLLWMEIKSMPNAEISVLMAWIGIIAFALQIYFDFSGYSDMAIGLGQMFGFRFKENFKYPYISQSISEFWRRWHISLGSWFREYVYVPLGGNRVGKLKLVRNLFIVWFLTGLWHGASWNFVLWGMYFGFLILVEKLFLIRIIDKLPQIIRHVYALIFIIVGWVFFEFANIEEILGFLQIMFYVGSSMFIDDQTIAIIRSNIILYIICISAAVPWYRKPILLFKKIHFNSYNLLKDIYYCILIFLSTAYMVSLTYNPFIYFRF